MATLRLFETQNPSLKALSQITYGVERVGSNTTQLIVSNPEGKKLQGLQRLQPGTYKVLGRREDRNAENVSLGTSK